MIQHLADISARLLSRSVPRVTRIYWDKSEVVFKRKQKGARSRSGDRLRMYPALRCSVYHRICMGIHTVQAFFRWLRLP
jgi:hypothetical protein